MPKRVVERIKVIDGFLGQIPLIFIKEKKCWRSPSNKNFIALLCARGQLQARISYIISVKLCFINTGLHVW